MHHRARLFAHLPLAGLERNLADQYAGYSGQSVRIDRLEERLGRIERRLELAD